jgi:transposase
MARLHAGLDVSLEMTSVCVVREEDRICLAAKTPGEPAALTETQSAFVPVGLEAGLLSQWLFFGLANGGPPAVCIETRRLKGAICDGGEQDWPKRRPRHRAGRDGSRRSM